MSDAKYADEKAPNPVVDAPFTDSDEEIVNFDALIAKDHGHDIQLRTMSWQKAAWLLAGDQVCLAIMAQSWSLSVLGWVPGIITMLLAGILFYFTSMTMWRFIMKYASPDHGYCDFGYYAFGKQRWAYHFTAFMLLANNIMLIGFHVLTGAKVINTLSDHSLCTVTFSVIVTLMGIAIRVHGHRHPTLLGLRAMNAVLNITFLWVPQILFPTFIAEMEKPQDFPKSLAVLSCLSAFLFIVPPAVGFRYLGQYATAPAFGSLGVVVYKKASFAFVIVPTLVIEVIYANVSAKYVYKHLMRGSHNAHSNTLIGWGVWTALMAAIWWVGFTFAEVIPSMGDFLSLLGAAFDSFFGFIYFAVAYWQMNKRDLFGGFGRTVKTVFHAVVMVVGLFLLGPGLYAACDAIVADYSGSTRPAFSCADLSI
ncbi:neutral amino acid [Paraphaeosphaeria minitans]|uniref:Neutral amino acid n=1 Tax=Paraphaeosphaeria minitans TaxID=565426 RepID=A0A9P6GQ38_9PLEO|nr:neutral amino acid [Paraphaeosphaeria minitans]